MKSKMGWGVLIGAVSILGVVALVTRSSTALTLFAGATMALALGVLLTHISKSRSAAAAVHEKRWWFVIGGVGFAIAGFAVSMTIAMKPGDSGDWATAAGAIALLFGLFVAMLPRMVAQTKAAVAEVEALAQIPPASARFDGVAEGVRAWSSVLADWRRFIAMAGPWALAFSVLLYIGVKGLGAIEPHSGKGLPTLLVLMLAILTLLTAVPTIFVAWSRWIVRGQEPRFGVALPNRAAWSIGWRLWAASLVLKTPEEFVTERIEKALGPGELTDAAASLATGAIDILALIVASGMAIRLTALALQNPRLSPTVAQLEGRRLWPGLPLGLVIAVVPPYVLMMVIGWLTRPLWPEKIAATDVASPVGILTVVVGVILSFAAAASAAALLARAYERVLARVG